MNNNLVHTDYFCQVCSKLYKTEEDWNDYAIWLVRYGLCPECSAKLVKEVKDENKKQT